MLAPWTEQVAAIGTELAHARAAAIEQLQPHLTERAAVLGLDDVTLRYEPAPVTVVALEARLQRDLDRGWTTLGPHLDDVAILAGDRDLRLFGSQGEQRLAVLSLLLAEAALLFERGRPALLLLDDVLSELDTTRRRALAGLLEARGQTIVTSTSAEALPAEPAQVVQVTPGTASAA